MSQSTLRWCVSSLEGWGEEAAGKAEVPETQLEQ